MQTHLYVALACVLSLAIACVGGSSSTSDPTRPAATPPATTEATAIPSPRRDSATPRPDVLIIRSGTLINGTGADPLPNAYVVVEADRVVSVGSGEPPSPPGARVIDARGGTILPGLSDSHVHIARQLQADGQPPVNEANMRAWLEAGFTHLRDVGTPPTAFPSVRISVDQLAAEHKSPRVLWAGPMITVPGGYPFSVPRYADAGQEARGTDDARAIVNRLADGGARVIKLGLERGYYGNFGWPLLSLEEVQAITQAAHSRGLRVTAHVTSLDEVRLAVDGGVDDLAHAPLETMSDEMMVEMLSKGITMSTTASVWGDRTAGALAAANAKRYMDAGGVVELATDFGCCGQAMGMPTMLAEMEFLIAAGEFTPMEVMVAATRNGLIASGLGAEAGTIETGKIADMIIVAGNPLADIRALANVRSVIQGGRIIVDLN